MFIFFIKSLVLGIIQGFAEFLPISSTAHLILSANLMRLEMSEFIKSFIVIIQFGSILAVIILYWKKLWNNKIVYFKKLMTAFIPTAIIGLLGYSLVKNFLQESLEIISLALFLGGIAIVILERKYQERSGEVNNVSDDKTEVDISVMSYKQCFIVGIFQSLAIVPGVSRSAATILGGLSLGISRLVIVEFSFLLAIPTMLAASSLDLVKTGFNFNLEEIIFLIIGFLASFVVAWISIKFLLRFIKKNNFSIFGWYRIVLGVALFLLLYAF
ncbi:MAG TPA: undecaprenyl-diphosphate phosphatase [bacterium]|nr:undecaprenyl-diphosphate phosphatase [bacterium]